MNITIILLNILLTADTSHLIASDMKPFNTRMECQYLVNEPCHHGNRFYKISHKPAVSAAHSVNF